MKLYPFLCFCFAFTLIKAAQRETLTKKEVFGNITNRLMIKDREHEVLNIPEGYTYPGNLLFSFWKNKCPGKHNYAEGLCLLVTKEE